MSIGKQVADAIDKMIANDPEGALHALCSAIDATATKEYGKRGRASFKDFIGSNFGLITGVAFGPKILNMRLGFVHPDLKPTPDGTHSIQDIFYVAVRCNLYHETALPPNITFVKDGLIQVNNGAIVLCERLIYGLMTVVVVAPVNHAEQSPNPNMICIKDVPLPISKLWGKRAEFSWLLESLNEASGIIKTMQLEYEREQAWKPKPPNYVI